MTFGYFNPTAARFSGEQGGREFDRHAPNVARQTALRIYAGAVSKKNQIACFMGVSGYRYETMKVVRLEEAVTIIRSFTDDPETGDDGRQHPPRAGLEGDPRKGCVFVSEPGMELVVPGIGEVVALDDARQVAFALDAIRDLERQFRSIKTELTAALVYASQREGVKTLHLEGGISAVIKSGTEVEYDAEAIEHGLREAGMPEARIREIVVETVSYKVAAVKAKQAAAANPVYGEVIEACRSEVEKPPYVTISRK